MKLQLIVRRAPFVSGNHWLNQAWQLFRLHPGLMIGMNAFIIFTSIAAAVIPVIGVLLFFVLPFLQSGFYAALVAAQQQKPVNFDLLFSAFKITELRAPFMTMAAAQILCSLPQMYFTNQIVTNFEAGNVAMLDVLAAVALHMINLMLFAFAVPIIYFLREKRLLPVVQSSLTACWRNVLPLSWYFLLVTTMLFGAIILISLLSSVLPFAQILIVPVMLVVMAVNSIAMFLAFTEIFALIMTKEQPSQMFEV